MPHSALGARLSPAVLSPASGAPGRSPSPLWRPLQTLGYVAHEEWAWSNYKATVLAFAAGLGGPGRPARLLEIGGGRDPLFTPAEARLHRLAVTVNDIDAGELARAPDDFGKALFDVAGEPADLRDEIGRYDLIYSRMVFEHIPNAARAWSNCRALLREGGVALAFYPTLYAPPYVINRMFPEWLSAKLLRLFFPHRNDGAQPKFPAHYDWCFGDEARLAPMFEALGFSDYLVAPFWTHGYFRSIPGLREADAALQNLARRRDWRALTTYAYALARR